jgi:demethylmenaquinone methyltransferase/2-methoxy-6-polyprenyl-1,4-benzoquinol methylase
LIAGAGRGVDRPPFFPDLMSSSQRECAEHVRGIFDRIAGRYDLLNRVISFHLDTYWRKKAVAAALGGGERRILDLGTGTGDLAFAAAEAVGRDGKIFALDFSGEMLRLALRKKRAHRDGGKTFFILASALAPPFADDAFDAVMTAFVLRNVADLRLFFLQAYRLLRPGGRLVTMDMFPPSCAPFSFFYSLYFYRLMPWIAARLARDREAYRYLSTSVKGFHSPQAIAEMIRETGFESVTIRKFLNGAVCLHIGDKPGKL